MLINELNIVMNYNNKVCVTVQEIVKSRIFNNARHYCVSECPFVIQAA